MIDTEWLTLKKIQLKNNTQIPKFRSFSKCCLNWLATCEARPKVYSSRFFARRGTPAAQLPQLPHAVTKRRALDRFVGTKWAPKTTYPGENPKT